MTKHKWHDVIVAYLNGQKIQRKYTNDVVWIPLYPVHTRETFVNFSDPHSEFRIVPTKTKVKVTRYKKFAIGNDLNMGEFKVINITDLSVIPHLQKCNKYVQELSDWIEEEIEIES